MNPRSHYDKFPIIHMPNGAGAAVQGWEAVGERLREAVGARQQPKVVLVVEAYPGVKEDLVRDALVQTDSDDRCQQST
jgi:hypothetical protein